ncbi:MAG: hypothetical protein II499_09005 [Firmicutes bacterium]|nr:hypothetical protein [Bacillota bacterium]
MRRPALKNGAAALIIALIAAAAAFFLLPRDDERGGSLRIGCGDDISGIYTERICEKAREEGLGESFAAQFTFADCCSNAAQWALETEDIDLGFYCSAAAHSLVSALDDYEIYGPAVMNCEVLAVRKGEDPAGAKVLGVPRGREFLGSLTEGLYPAIGEKDQVNRGYLMYALRSGDVDAVIADISAVSALTGEADFYPLSSTDYISYCLVIRKDLKGTKAFESFLRCLDLAAEELNGQEAQEEVTGLDEDMLKAARLKFIGSI